MNLFMRKIHLILSLAMSLLGASAASAFPIDPSPPIPVIEYVNDVTGHYFMTADPAEIAGLDGGFDGGTWHRTGQVLQAWPAGWMTDVCRGVRCPARERPGLDL
jgi:hypothetical protein